MKAIQRLFWSVALLLLFNAPVYAQTELAPFDQPEQRELYQELLAELRCLVCQNQNLADSNADLARDLRTKTEEMVRAGNSREEVVEYMVSRYGDFVLYRPPFKNTTAVLWVSPFALLLLIVFIAWRRIRRSAGASQAVLSDEQAQRAKSLLNRSGK